ncbi:MAG: hypothetical protein IT380_16650 [Myxococcales bacterium]|nr:hypothetical protein [Myxococcales bacterium]
MTTRSCALLLAALVGSGCQCSGDSPLLPDGGDAGRTDEVRLSTATLCLTPELVSAPTKVLVLVDTSGSTCLSDPGTASDAGACLGFTGMGGVSRREATLDAFLGRAQAAPEALVSVSFFGEAVTGSLPSFPGGFVRPDAAFRAQVQAFLQAPPAGPSNLEGALAFAHARLSAEVQAMRQIDPGMLSRTTFRLVVLTDGPPSPRCLADDTQDAGATPAMVEGLWPDSSTFCNDVAGLDGGSLNQTADLLSLVDALKTAAAPARAFTFDTVFFFNDANLAACGPVCDDAFGRYAGVAPGGQYQAAKTDARNLLGLLSTRGGGAARDLDTAGTDNPLSQVDFVDGGVASAQVLWALPLRSVASDTAPLPDSDGDGLSDAREAEVATEPLNPDTDGDCLSDGFEVQRAAALFDPKVKDARGCDPASPMTPNCVCRDVDGDGLSQFEENVLGTSAALLDSDFDGVTDLQEARGDMDATRRQPLRDGDGDGALDVDEVRATSNPARGTDAEFRRRYAVSPRLTLESRQGAQECWDIAIDGLSTVTLQTDGGTADGYNLVKLLLGVGSAPDDILRWYGECVWVHRQRGGAAVPNLTFPGNRWRPLPEVVDGDCEGTAPP